MAAPTKEMKFCKELFNIVTDDENRIFRFERIEGTKSGYIISMDEYPTLKEACIYVKQCEETPEAPAEPAEKAIKPLSSDPEQPEPAVRPGVKPPKPAIKSLKECADKFPTDKITHGYIKIYEDFLPEKIDSLLEIGCWKGNSLRMWREYLPEATLATLDLFEEHKEPTDIEGLICFKGDQSDRETLDAVDESGQFDVVIDDGSHGSLDQWAVVDTFLRPGTVVVIEDLHCCEEKFWRQGIEFDETILGQMRNGAFPHRFDLFEVKKGSIIAFIYAD